MDRSRSVLLLLPLARRVLGNAGFACGQGPREVELGRNAFDAVGRVDVLDTGDLIAGGRPLS